MHSFTPTLTQPFIRTKLRSFWVAVVVYSILYLFYFILFLNPPMPQVTWQTHRRKVGPHMHMLLIFYEYWYVKGCGAHPSAPRGGRLRLYLFQLMTQSEWRNVTRIITIVQEIFRYVDLLSCFLYAHSHTHTHMNKFVVFFIYLNVQIFNFTLYP